MGDWITKNKQSIHNGPIVAVLLIGAFLAVLNQTLLITATPFIMREFDLTESIGQWVTTIFMLVNGIMIPITAFLMETFSTRKLFFFSMLTFIVGSIVCALTINFPMLMAGRVIQAVGAGVLMPLMMTIFMLIFPIERRGFAMGMAGLVISFAPAIGPALAGWLIDFLPWRYLFWFIIPIAVIDVLVGFYYMRNIISRTFPPVDYLSIILSALGFGGLLYGFSSIGSLGWTHSSVPITLIIGTITLFLFIRRQFTLEKPILEFRVLANKTFTYTMIIGMVTFTMLIAAETILPLYMQMMAGFTALESGMMILPGSLVMGFLSPFVGKIFDKIGARWLLIVGLSIMTVTTLFYTQLTPDTSFMYITVVFAVRMAGIAMVMMPSTTAGLNVLPTKLIPHGTAMTNTMRQVAASIGTAVLITIMSMTALSPKHEADMDALVHGVNVTFYVATSITFVALILSFCIQNKRKVN